MNTANAKIRKINKLTNKERKKYSYIYIDKQNDRQRNTQTKREAQDKPHPLH